MTDIELARCSTAAPDAPDWRKATVSVRRADWDAMSQEERARIVYGETADEDMRRMSVIVWLFAALVTAPVVAMVWWVL